MQFFRRKKSLSFFITKVATDLSIKIQALLSLVNRHRVGMFQCVLGSPGHYSTEYKCFYAASAGDVDKVTRYPSHSAYEPYITLASKQVPICSPLASAHG